MTKTTFLLFVLAAPALAQQPADAFVPSDYRCEVVVDFVALDKIDMVEPVLRSPVGAMFNMIEAEFGFGIADLTRLRAYPEVPRDGGAGERRLGSITIFEGNDNVGLPTGQIAAGCEAQKVGDTDLLVETAAFLGNDPSIYACPRPGLLVFGSEHLVRPALTGPHKAAVPPGDFLSLTSGRGNLAWFVCALSQRALGEVPFLTPAMWSSDDPPKSMMLRLRHVQQGDDDEGEVILDAVVRCGGKAGAAVVLQAARDALAAAEKHPRLSALRFLWQKIELRASGIDVQAHLPLGRPRVASGMLALMLTPLGFLAVSEAAPMQVQAVAVPVQLVPAAEPPAPAEKPKPAPAPKPVEPPKPAGGGNG